MQIEQTCIARAAAFNANHVGILGLLPGKADADTAVKLSKKTRKLLDAC